MCRCEWDPRVCPRCDELDDASDEAACRRCGATWDPDVCPACGASDFETSSLEELLYKGRTDGVACGGCGRWWRPVSPEDEERCAECGSEEVADAYPEIPQLGPELQLIVVVESLIPRTEAGTILHREMVAWLRFHGVRSRSEILEWEGWFIAIFGFRARMMDEMMEPKRSAETKDDEDRDGGYG